MPSLGRHDYNSASLTMVSDGKSTPDDADVWVARNPGTNVSVR